MDRSSQTPLTDRARIRLVDDIADTTLKLQTNGDLDPLLDQIGEARYVLLGEASHGTSEYYTWRSRLSQRLIQEKGFSFIAVEGDWPDCYRVNRYGKGYANAGESAYGVLQTFERWPTWIWPHFAGGNRQTTRNLSLGCVKLRR